MLRQSDRTASLPQYLPWHLVHVKIPVRSVGVINIEDIHQETTWKATIELNKSGRYEIELQFFAEGEEDLVELDRIRFVKNKIN